jgi:hypothetical protein
MASIFGVDVANSQIKQFEDDIEKGEILFLVDVPKERVEQIEALVKSHHPDADIEGTEPHIPAFPRSSALRMTKLRRQVSRNQALADQLAPATQRWEFPDLWRTTACQMPAPQY